MTLLKAMDKNCKFKLLIAGEGILRQNLEKYVEEKNMDLRLGDDDNNIDEVSAGTLQDCYRECSSLIFILDDLNSEFVHVSYNDYRNMPAKMLAVFKLYRHLLIMDKGKQGKVND